MLPLRDETLPLLETPTIDPVKGRFATSYLAASALIASLLLVVGVPQFSHGMAELNPLLNKKDVVERVVQMTEGNVTGTYDCQNFDDDTYFDEEICGEYDSILCSGTDSCYDSFWCNDLCGSMCSDGAGSICFFERLSDLEETCSHVKMVLANMGMKADKSTEESSLTQSFKHEGTKGGPGDGYGLHDDIGDKGCAVHSYCEYCIGDCASSKMDDYLQDTYDGVSVVAAKYAVFGIPETCKAFGYSI